MNTQKQVEFIESQFQENDLTILSLNFSNLIDILKHDINSMLSHFLILPQPICLLYIYIYINSNKISEALIKTLRRESRKM